MTGQYPTPTGYDNLNDIFLIIEPKSTPLKRLISKKYKINKNKTT